MKITKLIGMITIAAVAWHFLKKRKEGNAPRKPGALSRLVKGLKEEVSKPLNEVDDSIPSTASGT